MKEMHPTIRAALESIDFVKRYEELSNTFNQSRIPSEQRLVYIIGDEVMEIIRDLGYIPKFDAKEKFFKIRNEQEGDYTFRVHIILRHGSVEIVWVVYENKELLLGSPWGLYARLMIRPDYRIKLPVFGSYEDLEEILKISFKMYEDFKKAVLNQGQYSDLQGGKL